MHSCPPLVDDGLYAFRPSLPPRYRFLLDFQVALLLGHHILGEIEKNVNDDEADDIPTVFHRLLLLEYSYFFVIDLGPDRRHDKPRSQTLWDGFGVHVER